MQMTDDVPKISIISIIYKVERFLPKAIESMLGQTYPNLEIILVVSEKPASDGGGEDTKASGDLSVCRKYAEEDPRIKIVVTPARGTGDARNKGLDAASGDYIGFIDGDDWVEPDMIERLYTNLRSYDAGISVCGKYSEYKDYSEADKQAPIRVMDSGDAFEMILRNTGFFFHCWDKLFKAEIFEGLRFPDDRYLEDRYVIDKAIARAGRIVYDTTPLYHYRMRGDSLSRVKDMAEYDTEADTEFCDFACSIAPRLRDLADAFLLYDHLTCIQNYLLYFKGQDTDTDRMKSNYRMHMDYVRSIGKRIRGNAEVGMSLRIKRLLALYAPYFLAFITKRHIRQMETDRRFQ